MKILPATIKHSYDMQRIHTAAVTTTCSGSYTEIQIEAWLKGRSPEGYQPGIERGEMFVAETEGEIVGFGHAVPGEVLAMYVDPEFHKKGVGAMLIEHAISIAAVNHKKIKVEATVNAVGFYEKHGFKEIREDIYERNGVKMPKIIMERPA